MRRTRRTVPLPGVRFPVLVGSDGDPHMPPKLWATLAREIIKRGAVAVVVAVSEHPLWLAGSEAVIARDSAAADTLPADCRGWILTAETVAEVQP